MRDVDDNNRLPALQKENISLFAVREGIQMKTTHFDIKYFAVSLESDGLRVEQKKRRYVNRKRIAEFYRQTSKGEANGNRLSFLQQKEDV